MEIQQQAAGDDIDLRKVIATVWDGRWIVVGTTFLCSVLAVAYALLQTPIYRAEAVVQIRNEAKSGGGLAAVAAQLGGFSDFAGLLGGTDADRALTLATLKSRTLIQGFIADNDLLPVLFDGAWDAEQKRWKKDDPKEQPTLWHGHKLFLDDVLRITDDKKSGLVTVAIEWRDADVAAEWATELISRANAYLREKAIQESERNLGYLQQQLKQTGQIELQQSAYTLVEAELKKLMLAKGNEDYAIKTIDPAQAPQRRFKPNRVLIAVGGFLFGVMAGLLGLYFRSRLRPERVEA